MHVRCVRTVSINPMRDSRLVHCALQASILIVTRVGTLLKHKQQLHLLTQQTYKNVNQLITVRVTVDFTNAVILNSPVFNALTAKYHHQEQRNVKPVQQDKDQ